MYLFLNNTQSFVFNYQFTIVKLNMNRTLYTDAATLYERMNLMSKTRDDLVYIHSKLHTLSYFNIFIEQYLTGSNHEVLLDVSKM